MARVFITAWLTATTASSFRISTTAPRTGWITAGTSSLSSSSSASSIGGGRRWKATSTSNKVNCLPTHMPPTGSRTALRALGEGDAVTVSLHCTKEDGAPFDGLFDQGDNVRFLVGGSTYFPPLHALLREMDVGENRRISVDDAFGSANPEMVVELPIDQAPPGVKLGMTLRAWSGQKVRVTAVTDKSFTIDANPLNAGLKLNVDVTVKDRKSAAQLEKCDFAGGCFWGMELAFQRTPGVLGTKVGYTQGETKSPTYSDVCAGRTGHAEAVQVVYDPAEVTLDNMLRVFWGRHDPTQKDRQGNDVGTQYRSGIYYHKPEHLPLIEASLQNEQKKYAKKIATELKPATKFYDAELYHQQYLTKGGQDARKQATDPIRCYG